MQVKMLSLFSGIGAPEKALERLGALVKLVGYCEVDKYASKSYAAIHGVSEKMNLGDITKVEEKQLPKDIDLVTYGFPCQDISIAGAQKGLFNADGTQTRSGLFFEALRIIEETKPRVAIAENVKNLTSKKFAGQFKLVLDSLEAAGYNNYWKVLNAKDFGVPQNRERVFIVSIRKDIDNGTFKFPEGFPLEMRLKDVLEEEVDERFYLSEKMKQYLADITEKNRASGNGNVYTASDLGGVSKTITTKEGSRVKDNFIEELKVVNVGNTNPSGRGMNGNVISENGLSSTLTTNKGEGIKILVSEAQVEKVGTGIKGNGIGSNNAPKVLLSDEPSVKQIGCLSTRENRDNPSENRLYSPNGIAPTLCGLYGGNRKPLVPVEPQVKQIGNCCPTKTRDNPNKGRIYATEGLSPSLNCMGVGNRQPFVFCETKEGC